MGPAQHTVIERAPRRPQHLHLFVLGLAFAVAALAVGWMLVGHGATAKPAKSGPAIVSQAQLERFAATAGHPVYWAGPKPGYSYELTVAPGRVWVRYLPAGAKPGDPRPDFLVVGTYEQPHSYADLLAADKRPGSVSEPIADGGVLAYDDQHPTSVYFSYPRVGYQVEVYSPSPERARALVVGGQAAPVR
jgi:hypothetical protein